MALQRHKFVNHHWQGIGAFSGRYFMPNIRSILSMEEALGIETWKVVTNKGEREFQVRDPRHSVRHMPRGRVLIKDVDGNRYEVPNWRSLDRKSVSLLMRHL